MATFLPPALPESPTLSESSTLPESPSLSESPTLPESTESPAQPKEPSALDAPAVSKPATVSVPALRQTPRLPLLWALVAYSLDTQAMADRYLPGITTKEHQALCSFPVRRYLGLVTYVLRVDAGPWEYVVNFVGKPTSHLGDLIPSLKCNPLSALVLASRHAKSPYPRVPLHDLAVWTTAGVRVEITRHDDTLPPYQLSERRSALLEEHICAHYEMLRWPTPETKAAKDFKVSAAGHTIPVRLDYDLNTIKSASFDNPAGIVEEFKAVKRLLPQLP